jgi:GNAT superfamily N-acetyltransferase
MRRPLSDGYELDDDRDRVDVDVVHRFLSEEAYWVPGRSRDTIERLVRESTRVIAAYDVGGELVGFVRVVSDRSSFAWLGDVFVLAGHRGRGIGVELVGEAVEHASERDCFWYLNTRDAHSLYERFGFASADSTRTMTRPQRDPREPPPRGEVPAG